MSLTVQQALKLAAAGAVALSIAACASQPKPTPLASTGGTGQGETPYTPPGTAGPVTEQQSAAIPGSAQDFVVNVGDRIYFDFDAFDIRADAQPILAKQAAWLSRYPAVQVRIEGNCDERGTREYNFALGARRANSVREFLISHGVDAARITTVSYGKERPLDPGDDEDALAKNRNAHTDITQGAR
ncbi:MAG TPA: peptidoglycan-associated lipoprotein Pal [Caulobacteraceae bacterium]|nr:peptidoglycan-associated lipoprotein Pal [Caulobacteraceae bacterium]